MFRGDFFTQFFRRGMTKGLGVVSFSKSRHRELSHRNSRREIGENCMDSSTLSTLAMLLWIPHEFREIPEKKERDTKLPIIFSKLSDKVRREYSRRT